MRWEGARACLAATLCVLAAVLWARWTAPPPSRSSTAKLILVWVPFFGDYQFGFGGGGRDAFVRAGCAVTECELTADRTRVPLERFDALLFHGFEYYEWAFGVPARRSPRQLYVFASLEAAARTPIPPRRDRFYNLTMTYRLDSDVPWPYFAVLDASGARVAPAHSPAWREPVAAEERAAAGALAALLANKTRPAAWFVSNCDDAAGRATYARELSRHLPVDVYGACGELRCAAERHEQCARMVGERYHFYLALENSLCRDYVTEKAAWALAAGAVPVVRSGAELRRFLPPGSYVVADAEPAALAARLRALLQDRTRYARLLRWRALYRVELRMARADRYPPGEHPLCALCATLHQHATPAHTHTPTPTPTHTPHTHSVREWWMGSEDDPACH